MNKIENPFLLADYVSPTYFCDRKVETETLLSALRNGRNITLRSPRRIGKTGLIKNAFYYIQAENNVEALLRTYIQQCPNAHFIFSGSKQHLLSEMFSSPKRPFFRSTEKMGLDILDKTTYYEFARKFFLQKGISLEEHVFDKVLSFTDGITWYVQYLLNRLYEVCYNEITEQDVVDAMQYILSRETDDYQRMVFGLTKNQLDVLHAIAINKCVPELTAKDFVKQNKLPASSSIARATQYLLDNEIVYKSEKGYIVYDRFFGQWFKEQ